MVKMLVFGDIQIYIKSASVYLSLVFDNTVQEPLKAGMCANIHEMGKCTFRNKYIICMHVCMTISMYVCMYACMHTCMCVYVCMYVCMYVLIL